MTVTHYDAAWIERTLSDLARQAMEDIPPEVPAALIGIRSRGTDLVGRLLPYFREAGVAVEVGDVDVTLYRDDIGARAGRKPIEASSIPFDLTDRHIILVDDVLSTARTVRAALTELMDYGRPRVIRLLTLIDRGGRELPIQADYVGARLTVPEAHRLQVLLAGRDGIDAVVEQT